MTKKKKAKSEARTRFEFWLRHKKEDEIWLMDLIPDLKRKRQFAAAIRDGLMLIWDLRNGGVGVLLELFPNIRERLDVKTPALPPPDNSDLERQIAELKQILLDRGSTIPDTRDNGFPAMLPVPKAAGQGIGKGKLASINLSMPTFDDDDELDDGNTIVLNKSTGTNTGENFLASFIGLEH